MLRSLWIKIPTLIVTAMAFVAAGGGMLGVLAATITFLAGSAILMAVMFNPNASLWVRTLSRAPTPTDAVALTFDDGPDPKSTLRIAEVLEKHGIRGAFFVVGERVRQHPEILTRLHAAGHLICNHSDTHSHRFHFSLWSAFRGELQSCNRAIRDCIGKEPTLFRSPQGAKNPALADVLNAMNMTPVGWQVRAFDSLETDAAKIETRIVNGARAGSVIMLHDGSGLGGTADREPTISALPRIIEGLQQRGFRFQRLDELLQVEPYRDADPSEMTLGRKLGPHRVVS